MFITRILKKLFSRKRVTKVAVPPGKTHAKSRSNKKTEAMTRKKQPEFKRTAANPAAAQPSDQTHSPGHRKMNWKKFQEPAKMPRKPPERPLKVERP